jgi:hypothetical protein
LPVPLALLAFTPVADAESLCTALTYWVTQFVLVTVELTVEVCVLVNVVVDRLQPCVSRGAR